jgi:hypothetical protein
MHYGKLIAHDWSNALLFAHSEGHHRYVHPEKICSIPLHQTGATRRAKT